MYLWVKIFFPFMVNLYKKRFSVLLFKCSAVKDSYKHTENNLYTLCCIINIKVTTVLDIVFVSDSSHISITRYIQIVPFIMSLCKTVISNTEPTSAATSRDTSRAQKGHE